jgi:hypothetical protein
MSTKFPPSKAALLKQAFVATFLYVSLLLLEATGTTGAAMAATDFLLLLVAMEIGISVYYAIPGLNAWIKTL